MLGPLGVVLSIAALVTGTVSAQSAPARVPKQIAFLKASNAEAYDHFGCGGGSTGHTGNSVAMSRDGSILAIGAPFESGGATGVNGDQSDNSSYGSGAVYIFVRDGEGWVQQTYLKASNTGLGDHFGSTVALSSDGTTLAVSAHFESSAAKGIDGDQSDDSLPEAGAVYVFTRRGNTWSQQAYIKASNTGRAGVGDELGDGDQFGYSLAISGDGNTIAVGAIGEDSAAKTINGDQNDDSQNATGAVYVFTRARGRWSQQAYVKPFNAGQGDLFGFSVALNGDGNTLVASSFDEDGSSHTINGPDDDLARASGAVFVFTREGTQWKQTAYVKGSRNEETDQLGYAVAVSDDGNTIAAGAGDEDCLLVGVNPPGCDHDSPRRIGANIWVGAAYVFARHDGQWSEEAFIKASNARPYNSFGVKLALSGDGDTLAVAAYLQDEGGQGLQPSDPKPFLDVPNLDPWRDRVNQAEESGAVYVYRRDAGQWTQTAYLKASNAELGDEYGSAVALDDDGRIMAVGAHSEDSAVTPAGVDEDDNSASDSGAVYVYAN